MTDEEFLKAFENGEIEAAQFRHPDHLRLAWCYARYLPFQEGAQKVAEGIKQFAARNNAGGLYHETITMFWVSEIYKAVPFCPAPSFIRFVEKNPWLRDKTYINRFYSEELLKTDQAKREWVNPDRFCETNAIFSAL